MNRAPILDPNWLYIPAAAHGDAEAFRQRQRKRIAAAQLSQPTNVKPLTPRKASKS